MELTSEEAIKLVWEGAIPLQIRLHESEITTLPSPPPILVLGPRLGYLPLLMPLIKPHFSSTLPPGTDTIWFDYRGLPLKWHIPTGVLFDLLCAEPERPWNLTVHFRAHPGETLIPCQGEDNVKWSFINSLKEAAYIINGNCKNVMNMSEPDRFELWQSLVKGDMDSYHRVSSKLKLGPVGEDCMIRMLSSAGQPQQATGETDSVGPNRSCRIPVRLYVRSVGEEIEDIEDASAMDSWDKFSYINRPVEVHKDEGCNLTLETAVKRLLPEIFEDEPSTRGYVCLKKEDGGSKDGETTKGDDASTTGQQETTSSRKSRIKLIRIQGIELDPQIPFHWVVNNLKHPEYYLHICVFVGSPLPTRVR
ncbi:uncharacterized protein A4U43_C07F23490 [Asparagus officinalis]|uniref:Autophagy protein 5 n=1 Tax=Asparagus officinalis TaxID=4686 RepID=A0A5P1EHR6_ASPOF|nr:autophagy protein 5 [Asparagus officinalis]ONK64231.1 uncharacterized protein A4U43_C07F23490 [Asparagus officinalis]